MTQEDLQVLKRLVAAATPGPWCMNNDIYLRSSFIRATPGDDAFACLHVENHEHDAAFIAAARVTVPVLIAEVEKLRIQLAAARIEIAAYTALMTLCPTCGGSGEVDSGGVTPWGVGVDVTCPTCNGTGKAYDDLRQPTA